MEHELNLLLAERAITAVMNAYCHAIDTADHDRWLACFTDDALYEVALPDGGTYAALNGKADLERFIAAYPVLPGHRHVYVTPLFDVDLDVGAAQVAAYWFVLAGSGHGAGISSLGRVHDHFVLMDGRWRIQERRVATEGMAP